MAQENETSTTDAEISRYCFDAFYARLNSQLVASNSAPVVARMVAA